MLEKTKEQIQYFNKLLQILYRQDTLKDIMIIGSWAEYIYVSSGFLNYDFMLKTDDVDIFIPNISKPNKPINLIEHFKSENFSLIYDGTGVSHFNLGGILDLEFLVREIGSGQMKPYKTNLTIKAQGLRNMDILADNKLNIVYNNMILLVPSPEAYIIHKLIINDDRLSEKQKKDIDSICKLLRNFLIRALKFFLSVSIIIFQPLLIV